MAGHQVAAEVAIDRLEGLAGAALLLPRRREQPLARCLRGDAVPLRDDVGAAAEQEELVRPVGHLRSADLDGVAELPTAEDQHPGEEHGGGGDDPASPGKPKAPRLDPRPQKPGHEEEHADGPGQRGGGGEQAGPGQRAGAKPAVPHPGHGEENGEGEEGGERGLRQHALRSGDRRNVDGEEHPGHPAGPLAKCFPGDAVDGGHRRRAEERLHQHHGQWRRAHGIDRGDQQRVTRRAPGMGGTVHGLRESPGLEEHAAQAEVLVRIRLDQQVRVAGVEGAEGGQAQQERCPHDRHCGAGPRHPRAGSGDVHFCSQKRTNLGPERRPKAKKSDHCRRRTRKLRSRAARAAATLSRQDGSWRASR